MLLDMLPEDVAAETRDRPLLNTVQRVTESVSQEVARYNDKHLGKIDDDLASKALDHVQKCNKIVPGC